MMRIAIWFLTTCGSEHAYVILADVLAASSGISRNDSVRHEQYCDWHVFDVPNVGPDPAKFFMAVKYQGKTRIDGKRASLESLSRPCVLSCPIAQLS